MKLGLAISPSLTTSRHRIAHPFGVGLLVERVGASKIGVADRTMSSATANKSDGDEQTAARCRIDGVHRGRPEQSGIVERAMTAPPPHAVFCTFHPSSVMVSSRMTNFWIFPVTVIGNASTNLT